MNNCLGYEDVIAWLNTDDYDSAGYHAAIEHAIGAVKKQIKKKPNGNRATLRSCPTCGMLVEDLFPARIYRHCSHCGQAIDWSEV